MTARHRHTSTLHRRKFTPLSIAAKLQDPNINLNLYTSPVLAIYSIRLIAMANKDIIELYLEQKSPLRDAFRYTLPLSVHEFAFFFLPQPFTIVPIPKIWQHRPLFRDFAPGPPALPTRIQTLSMRSAQSQQEKPSKHPPICTLTLTDGCLQIATHLCPDQTTQSRIRDSTILSQLPPLSG